MRRVVGEKGVCFEAGGGSIWLCPCCQMKMLRVRGGEVEEEKNREIGRERVRERGMCFIAFQQR